MPIVCAKIVTPDHGYTSLEIRRKADGTVAFCLVKKWQGGEVHWLGPVSENSFIGRDDKGEILLVNEEGAVTLPENLLFISEPGFFQMIANKTLGAIFPRTFQSLNQSSIRPAS